MSVLPFGCWRRCRLSGLLVRGVAFDEGGDPVVQFIDPVESAVAAGDHGDFRGRHEASPGLGLRRGEHGAACAGDQQDRHVDRAEFVIGEDAGELRLHPVAADGGPHERHQLRLHHGRAVQPPGEAAAQRHRGEAGQAADGHPPPEAGVELGEPGGVEQRDGRDPPGCADRLVHGDPAAVGEAHQVRRAVAELAQELVQPGGAGRRGSHQGARDAGVRVAGHIDPIDRAVPCERRHVREPGRCVAPGTGEQHDWRTIGMRPVGVHARGRGRRLDIELLAGLRPQREGPLVGGHELLPCRIAYPRSRLALRCRACCAGDALDPEHVPPPRGLVCHLYDTKVSLTDRAANERYGERVPKRVDHEERRRQTAAPLLRPAATRGLHATGMREVAAEAGVSLRLVQYYFGTKEELMLAAMQQLAAEFSDRVLARIQRTKETGSPASPRDVIAAILTEALPADDERRTFTLVYTAYLALSLTDPALAINPLVRNSNAVSDVIAAQLRTAQADGDMPAGLDPELEAISLMTMSAGLGTSVLADHSSPEQAQAVIDYHLRRLFPAYPPA